MGIRKIRATNSGRVMALLLAVAAAGCSGGSGPRIPVIPNAPGLPPAHPAPPPPPPPDFFDTGIAGSVGAPAPASFGSAPALLATPGGATFDNPNGPLPTDATFPLIFTGLQQTSTGLSAVSGDQGATVTFTSTNAVIANGSTQTTMQLTIPSLGVNRTLTDNLGLASPYRDDSINPALSYVVMGRWEQRANQPSNSGALQSTTSFVFGYETPQAAMPTSGTAVFSGGVTATIYKPVNGEIQVVYAEGGASISANFGSGSVSGRFGGLQLDNNQLPWNDVSVAGNVATGTNKFSGTTAAASAPGGPMSLSASATGHIDGAFFGPAAQNLGAVWSLSDGTGSAIGTVTGIVTPGH